MGSASRSRRTELLQRDVHAHGLVDDVHGVVVVGDGDIVHTVVDDMVARCRQGVIADGLCGIGVVCWLNHQWIQERGLEHSHLSGLSMEEDIVPEDIDQQIGVLLQAG
ncbi:hypothetical protein JHK82_045813 [Glycine max]|nr:hypothetical protein GLYMA_16G019800v4 [Glycine max]KAG4938007.1 hypothetical protein JHK86_044148 [Glycine max]KAG5100761.1 hypothetical protein JHK82_045813 [Glycine max]KAG5107344.1 hypothetical protein JHK84_044251 [Glycine max]KAH1149542.1 hypothetical protein GYH30_043871 [Glycine max]